MDIASEALALVVGSAGTLIGARLKARRDRIARQDQLHHDIGKHLSLLQRLAETATMSERDAGPYSVAPAGQDVLDDISGRLAAGWAADEVRTGWRDVRHLEDALREWIDENLTGWPHMAPLGPQDPVLREFARLIHELESAMRKHAGRDPGARRRVARWLARHRRAVTLRRLRASAPVSVEALDVANARVGSV